MNTCGVNAKTLSSRGLTAGSGFPAFAGNDGGQLPCGKGFSLLEVLIALFILSLALLGIASLETVSLRQTYASYLHSVADAKTVSAGFSLIEILVAISLGLILTAGISRVYLSVKNTYQKEQNIARVQENGRFAAALLTRNIRMSGYSGCLSSGIRNPIQVFHTTSSRGSATSSCGLTAGSRFPAFAGNDDLNYLQGKVKPDTDIIIIKKADTNVTQLAENINAPTNTIKVINNPATKNNPQLLISDCEHNDKFIAESFGKEFITANKTLANYKKADTEVAGYTETAYFIPKTADGLYVMVNNGRKEELIDGVNNMQIKYSNNKVSIVLTLNAGDKKIITWPIIITLKEPAAAQY